MTRRSAAVLLGVLGALATPGAPALAAAPPNDAPSDAAGFEAVTAENGTPDERQGIAELAEATADPGVPSCLGSGSFARTVWFRVPAAGAARELQVEASGRTTAVLDLAAFVQPGAGGAPSTSEPNACAGEGAGGADASEEPTAGVVLRVPAGRDVLVQVGRRGTPGSADDERAILSLAARDLPDTSAPAGDVAGSATPPLTEGAAQPTALGGATITGEDPATPPCPSLGTIWRRYVPTFSGPAVVVAGGAQSATLTTFAGLQPTGDNVRACVDRVRSAGDLALAVTAQARSPLWVRVGTDRPGAGDTGTLQVVPGGDADASNSGGGSPSVAASDGGAGLLAPATGAPGARGTGASGTVCAEASGFRVVATRPSRSRLRLGFERAVRRPVTIDVFQQSAGRSVVGERLVARFSGRSRSLTWNGRANRPGRRVTDGFYVVRYRIANPGGGTDVRRQTLRRAAGRFTVRPDFYRRATCDLVRSYKLLRPVFGGRSNRAMTVSYRLTGPARVTLEVLRGARVVRRIAVRRSVRGGVTYRARFDAENRPRGDYRFRLVATPDRGPAVRTTLTGRRL